VVQRVTKIGFEIEDGAWRSWKTTHHNAPGNRYFRTPADSRGVRPMAKHEVLHDATGFKVEADEFDDHGLRLSDLEFVTDPVPLTASGRDQLMRTLDQVARIYSTILPLRGRNHAAGEFVEPNEHHLLRADVLLSRGTADARVRVQATHGLSLADVPRLYRALGAGPEDQERPNGLAPKQLRYSRNADPSTKRPLDVLRSAPDRALKLSLSYLERTITGDPVLTDTSSLVGFLTVLLAFVRGMHAGPMKGGIKQSLPVMHRNDFATMFALLPTAQRELLRANQQCFIEAILAGLFGDPALGIDDLDLAKHVDQQVVKSLELAAHERRAFTGDAELPTMLRLGQLGIRILCYRPLPRTMTIERWIKAWMSDRDPVDLLTAEHFDATQVDRGSRDSPSATLTAIRDARDFAAFGHLVDWTRSYEQGRHVVSLVFAWDRLSSAQQAILRDSVRELGGLGCATDSEHADLALFENRAFRPGFNYQSDGPDFIAGRLSVEALSNAITSYFSGMLGLFGVP
jgi:hypothetical protein